MTTFSSEPRHIVSQIRSSRMVKVVVGALLLAATVPAFVAPVVAQASTPSLGKPLTVVEFHSTTKYGRILASNKGFTLYTYYFDKKNYSHCYGKCLLLWRPLLIPKGDVPVGKRVTHLGVIVRLNGQHQVTYNGKPLYLYIRDTKPGEVSGEGVNHFHFI